MKVGYLACHEPQSSSEIAESGRVLKSLCDGEYVWEHGNMTENFSDECALREFMRI